MTEAHPHDVSEAQTITIKKAAFCLGVTRSTIYAWMKAGRLQTVKAGCRRLIVVRSVRILATELHRLPELHRLIEQIRPWYSADTIEGLRQIVAATEARLSAA